MLPGGHPVAQLEEALGEARSGTVLLLVIDRFEQVFSTGTEEPERARFLDRMSAVLADPGIDAVYSDHVDRMVDALKRAE